MIPLSGQLGFELGKREFPSWRFAAESLFKNCPYLIVLPASFFRIFHEFAEISLVTFCTI